MVGLYKGHDNMKISDKQIMNAIVKHKYNLTHAAKELGRCRTWISKKVNNKGHLSELYQEGREIRVDNAENMLDKLIEDGDVNAVRFTLSTLGKRRGYGKSIEITGDASKPITLIAKEMSPEEAAKLYQETLKSELES
jgi:hypothetical protein